MWMCVPLDMRVGSENSSGLQFKLTAQRYGTSSTSRPRNHLKTVRFAVPIGNKNCSTCDQVLTISLWTIPSLWIHLYSSPSLPCLFSLFLSASMDQLCVLSFHTCNKFTTKQPLPLPLTATHRVHRTPDLARIVTSHSFLFLCFVFRDVQSHLRHILWVPNCDLRGSGSVRVCAHTWRDCAKFLCWMAHVSHVFIGSLPRACFNM